MAVALVTGSSRGIGAAVAEALAQAGWSVCLNYICQRALAEAHAARLQERYGVGTIAVGADVAEAEAVAAMFRRCEAELGQVELLVNNAGIAVQAQIQDIRAEDWRRQFAVNVDGCLNTVQAALPSMLRRKSGVIVNISSMWGLRGAACEAAYSATKHAIVGLTRSMAAELAPSGIRVNAVAPGVIDTDMVQVLGAETLAALAAETPLGRLGSPAEVAAAVRYLAEADFVTGQVLLLDGGFSL